MLKFALAKGRLGNGTIELLNRCGVELSENPGDTRKLQFYDSRGECRFLMVKPTDVPTYVDHGVSDLGVAGKDTLLEAGLPLYEMLDLGFGKCRMCVCGYPEKRRRLSSALRVATKYPNIARRYYESRGEAAEIIKLNGSVELSPILGLSDVIMDIVESGRTLEENGLVVLEEVCAISARLVVNRVSLKTRASEITGLIERIKREIGHA